MLKEEKLPKEVVGGKGNVRKLTIEGLNLMQGLTIESGTDIEKHGHGNQWEVWLDLENRIAYICGKGKEHQISNLSDKEKKLMAIKGDSDVAESDLAQFFTSLGMKCFIS